MTGDRPEPEATDSAPPRARFVRALADLAMALADAGEATASRVLWELSAALTIEDRAASEAALRRLSKALRSYRLGNPGPGPPA